MSKDVDIVVQSVHLLRYARLEVQTFVQLRGWVKWRALVIVRRD
jgi:hypothetical protein